MNLFNLVVMFCGSVEYTGLFKDSAHARGGLTDWCVDHWQNDDYDPGDYSNEEVIEMFFDYCEDYTYFIDEVAVPKEQAPGQEILLTPARCRIIQHALSNTQYGDAQGILNELDEEGDGAEVIQEMIQEFQA
jgi:hypothetical protein